MTSINTNLFLELAESYHETVKTRAHNSPYLDTINTLFSSLKDEIEKESVKKVGFFASWFRNPNEVCIKKIQAVLMKTMTMCKIEEQILDITPVKITCIGRILSLNFFESAKEIAIRNKILSDLDDRKLKQEREEKKPPDENLIEQSDEVPQIQENLKSYEMGILEKFIEGYLHFIEKKYGSFDPKTINLSHLLLTYNISHRLSFQRVKGKNGQTEIKDYQKFISDYIIYTKSTGIAKVMGKQYVDFVEYLQQTTHMERIEKEGKHPLVVETDSTEFKSLKEFILTSDV